MKTIIGEAIYILVNFVGRGVWWGVGFGAVLGIPCGFMVFSVFGIFWGAAIGILSGGITGLMLGFVTIIYRRSLWSEPTYQRSTLIAAIATTFVVNTAIFYRFLASWTSAAPPHNPNDLIIAVVLGTISAVPAAYASQRVAKWYRQNRLKSLIHCD